MKKTDWTTLTDSHLKLYYNYEVDFYKISPYIT